MKPENINFEPELSFKLSRSGGKGGQNVNKVETKVELNFDVLNSALLSDKQKEILLDKLSTRINKEGILKVVSQKERSQLLNKQLATEKFYHLVIESLAPKKKRVATKPGKAAKEKRLKQKKQLSEKKSRRKFGPEDF